MANICSNHVHIEGSAKDIAPLREAISNQDPELLGRFCWFAFTNGDYGLWNDCYTPEEESISLSFGSKWSFPGGPFESLVADYPRLSFEVYSEESATELFMKITASDGEAHLTYLTPLEYYTAMNEDFAKERRFVENPDYEEFLRHVLEDEVNDDLDHLWTYLDPLIINRIKKKDLPLFIDREWYSEENAEKFAQKLKGEKTHV